MKSPICTLTSSICVKTEGLYHALFEGFPHGLIVTHENGQIFDCNSVAEIFFECRLEEMGNLFSLLTQKKAVKKDGTLFERHEYPMYFSTTSQPPASNVTIGIKKVDGTNCWLEVSARSVFVNRCSNFSGVATFWREITEEKEVEDLLALYHNELRRNILKRTAQLEFALGQVKLAVIASNTGLWNWNLRTGQLYFSPEWKRQIGYADHEIGNTMDDWIYRIHADDRGSIILQIKAYLNSPSDSLEIAYRMQHRNGCYLWILLRATATLDEKNKAVFLQGSHVDISERKRSEENLLELTRELRDVSRELARVEEAERRRFAQELHDTVGSALAALSINMAIMSGEVAGEKKARMEARLKDSIVLLDDTTDAVRRLMAELRPPVLDDYGLEAALRWQCELFAERCGFLFSMEVYGTADRLEPELEISLFRIAQGAITNIAKHAVASHVHVMLDILHNSATLTITDDGIGFFPNLLRDQKLKPTWGLRSMRERAQALGGNLKIISAPGKGTRVEVTVNL